MPSRSRLVVVTIGALALLSLLLLHFNIKDASPLAKIFSQPSSIDQVDDKENSDHSQVNEEPWVLVSGADIQTGIHDFSCPSNIDWLDGLHLTYPIRYARRDIIVRPTPGLDRSSVTHIKEPLFPGFQTLMDPASSESDTSYCKAPLVLEVPLFSDDYADASHVIFGVSTTLERLEDSIPFFERWLSHTKGRLIAQVVGPDDKTPSTQEMKRLESMMNQRGICATLVKPLHAKDTMPERYFALVKLAYEHRDDNTRWIGIFDDDTFVISMPQLLDMLNKHDDTTLQYLGALSEEWWTVGRYGLMGMGGAGVFLSVPLAGVLHENYQSCRDRSGAGAGDIRIFECIEWHTDVKLTHITGLHQIDLHGDRSGLFESGRQLLTVHHWKEGWWDEDGMRLVDSRPMNWFPMASMHLVASVCYTCFLQRWQFGNDMVLSNGYSIATYPTGELGKFPKDMGLQKVEHTWLTPAVIEGSHNEGFDHYLGPLRPGLELERDKIQYRYLDAVAIEGGVRQWYVRLGNITENRLDELVELFWSRERPMELKNPLKGPRL